MLSSTGMGELCSTLCGSCRDWEETSGMSIISNALKLLVNNISTALAVMRPTIARMAGAKSKTILAVL